MRSAPLSALLPFFVLVSARPVLATGSTWSAPDAAWSCGGLGAATSTAAGDVTGDGRPDVAYLIAGTVYFCDAPGVWGSITPTTITATDIAYSPSSDPATPGTFAMIDSAGLYRLTWNPSTRTLDQVAVVTGSPRWTNTQRLVVRKTQSNGLFLANVGSDGRTITVRIESGSSSSQTAFTLASTVVALALVNWDGDADFEVAAVTQSSSNNALRVREVDGSAMSPAVNIAIAHAPTDPTVASLVPLRAPEQTVERIAWLRLLGGGGEEIDVVSNTLEEQHTAIPSSFPSAVSLIGIDAVRAGDTPTDNFPGDGDTDLLVTRMSWTAPLLMFNGPDPASHPNGDLFSTDDKLEIPGGFAQPYDSTSCLPAVADFDGNGAQDVLFISQPLNSLPPPPDPSGLIQVALQLGSGGAGLGECPSCLGAGVFKSADFGNATSSDSFLDLSLQLSGMAPNIGTAEYNALQVLTWKEVDDESSTANAAGRTVEHVENRVFVFDNDHNTENVDPELVQIVLNNDEEDDAMTCGDSVQDASRVAWIEARLIKLADPNFVSSNVTVSGPTWVLFAANHPSALCARRTGETGYLNFGGCGVYEPYEVCTLQIANNPPAPGLQQAPSTYLASGTRRKMAPGGNLSLTPVTPATPQQFYFQ